MNDQKNEKDTEPKILEIIPIYFVIFFTCLGIAMIIWYDIFPWATLDNILNLPKILAAPGMIFLLWNRPVGIFLLFFGLKTFWDRKRDKMR